MIKKLAQFFFFGNYFLAFCIAMLSCETVVQFGFHPFSLIYFAEVVLLTKVYYTHAYQSELKFYKGTNVRTQWYVQHRLFISSAQKVYTIIAIILLLYFCIVYYYLFAFLSIANLLLLALFPLLAFCYYGISFIHRSSFSLRRYGRLKPFVIGFVATGAVTVYPLVFFSIIQQHLFNFTTPEGLYFLANFMFTSVIAIMFDIKDYASDYNHHLKTLVVHFGLRKSIYYVLFPFIITGIVSLLTFAVNKQYSLLQILINCIPFLLLAIVAWTLQQRKKMLYYLAVIDGLLLVKAICGITAILV